MKTDQGIVRVKRLCNNAKLLVRRSASVAGYDLAAAQTAVAPAHGKLLEKQVCRYPCLLVAMVG